MFVSVGSLTNDYEDANAAEENRADILQYNPDGTGFRIFATGFMSAYSVAFGYWTVLAQERSEP